MAPVFLLAKEEFRSGGIAAEYGVSREKAIDMIKKVDRLRHDDCRHFPGAPWGWRGITACVSIPRPMASVNH